MYIFSKVNALILTQSREEEQRDVCEHVAGVWVQPLLQSHAVTRLETVTRLWRIVTICHERGVSEM